MGTNSLDWEWVNNREWFLEKDFQLPKKRMPRRIILHCMGLDFSGEIHLNNQRICGFEGMFIPVEKDITDKVNYEGTNTLRFVFYQSPELDGQYGYTSRIDKFKARFSYVWDWCPRIVPVGIWDDVYIECSGEAGISDFYPESVKSDDGWRINSVTELNVYEAGIYELRYMLFDNAGGRISIHGSEKKLSAGKTVCRDNFSAGEVNEWYPRSEGNVYCYTLQAEILKEGRVIAAESRKVGFRRVSLVPNSNSPDNALPYTVTVNEKKIFLKGVNYVPVSPLYGTVTEEDYRRILSRFAGMNCNLIRVWGGGLLEKDIFYSLCDELGFMVWQEFPLSSSGIDNAPPDDTSILKDLETLGTVFVKKIRSHPSLVIWCGGNELMTEGYVPVDEANEAVKLLGGLVKLFSPETPFLPASPSGPVFSAELKNSGKGIHHDVHGPWLFKGTEEHFRYFNEDDAMVRTEVGTPGASRKEILDKFKGEFSLWPPDETNPYWTHRGAWWIQWKEMSSLFGEWKSGDIEEYLTFSRMLQAESLRYAARGIRKKISRYLRFPCLDGQRTLSQQHQYIDYGL